MASVCSPPTKIRKLNEDEYTPGLVCVDEDEPRSVPGPMDVDEDVPRLLWGVPELPEGAWARWGSQAVYFVGKTRDFPYKFGGLSIYAINPTDKSLPVYHVFDFTYPCIFGQLVSGLSCAVVGSSAYVSGNGTGLWVRQIGDKDDGWVEGPQFSRDKRSPDLFSLGGRLYALRYFHQYDLGRESEQDYPHAFEVLVNGSWRSLHAPPPCFSGSLDGKGVFEEFWIAGWSCIGDRTMVVHSFNLDRQRFFRFHLTDDFQGSWTELSVSVPGASPFPFPCSDFTYTTHLCADDPLLLPAFSHRAIFSVVGLAAAPAGDRSLELEVGEDIQFPWGLFRPKCDKLYWHLISLGRYRYCAIAFDRFTRLNPTIFTFDLRLAGAETASLENVCVKHHAFGEQLNMKLLSGKAYSC